ncbi:MAG TPA: hypothetical protein VK629_04665 [Steroidobacteraceae bacterium]|nr:hypothetical protein [Steroidobacteraceae bacterium]
MKLAMMSAVLGVLLVTTAAHADLRKAKFRGTVTLATPVAQKKDVTIKGIVWQCEGSQCVAEADQWPGLDKFARQCKIVAGELGDLTAFHSSGRNATKSELSRCNSAARVGQTQNAG